jgi:hypothetical protein
MPINDDDESRDIMITSVKTPATPRFSDDEEDDDDYEHQSIRTKLLDHDYDDDDEMPFINDESKLSADIYNISILQAHFPFDRFRTFINERTQHLVISYSSSNQQNKSSLLIQIYKQIVLLLSDKRPLVIIQPSDPAGPISSFSMMKFERHSEKFQSRLLSIFDEQTIVHSLLCLWLVRDIFYNRFLPSIRVLKSNSIDTNFDQLTRDLSPQKLKRSIKQSPMCIFFRLIKDDRNHQDIYIKLLQAMYFFQPELASIFLYYLSVEVTETKVAADLFDRFAKDIIKLSSSHRK